MIVSKYPIYRELQNQLHQLMTLFFILGPTAKALITKMSAD
jgi:hypothetical protein